MSRWVLLAPSVLRREDTAPRRACADVRVGSKTVGYSVTATSAFASCGYEHTRAQGYGQDLFCEWELGADAFDRSGEAVRGEVHRRPHRCSLSRILSHGLLCRNGSASYRMAA